MTTDPQDELFDVLDLEGRPTGCAKPRAAVHADGDPHAAVHIWIVTTAHGRPEVVLQRRSATKDTWPGRLDVAVGGHVRAGESVAETLREAEEELGLALAPSEVVRIGLRQTDVRSQPGVVDVELQEVFAALAPVPLTTFVLHPEEVDAVVRLPLTDARLLLVERAPVEVAVYERGTTGETAAVVSGDDVLPDEDGYYAVALDALDALCDGRSPAPFTVRPSAA